MTTVIGIIPGSDWRQAGADVEATLINAETGIAIAGVDSNDDAALTVVAGSATGDRWTISLTPNDEISTASGAATLWSIQRTGNAPQTYIVRVPLTGTHLVGSLVTSLGRGFLGTSTPAVAPEVTGSRDANAALASLLVGLDTAGVIIDSSEV